MSRAWWRETTRRRIKVELISASAELFKACAYLLTFEAEHAARELHWARRHIKGVAILTRAYISDTVRGRGASPHRPLQQPRQGDLT